AAPLGTEAQPSGKVPRIALVISTSPVTEMLGSVPVHRHVRAFLEGLRELGYEDGRDIRIERRSAEGRVDRLPDLFAELGGYPVHARVTGTAPVALAAKRATSKIPDDQGPAAGVRGRRRRREWRLAGNTLGPGGRDQTGQERREARRQQDGHEAGHLCHHGD